jgi:hypothetical protein
MKYFPVVTAVLTPKVQFAPMAVVPERWTPNSTRRESQPKGRKRSMRSEVMRRFYRSRKLPAKSDLVHTYALFRGTKEAVSVRHRLVRRHVGWEAVLAARLPVSTKQRRLLGRHESSDRVFAVLRGFKFLVCM